MSSHASYCAIEIDALVVPIKIGILDHERQAAQDVEISMRLYTDAAYVTTATQDSLIDYGQIAQSIVDFEHAPHIDLVETLMLKLLDIAFSYAAVDAVTIKIMKPDIIPNAKGVGVETHMNRKTYQRTCVL